MLLFMADGFAIKDAQTRLAELVRRAEAGERVVLMEDGREVAAITPIAPEPDREARRKWLDEMTEHRETLRARGVTATQEEIREWINEGRR